MSRILENTELEVPEDGETAGTWGDGMLAYFYDAFDTLCGDILQDPTDRESGLNASSKTVSNVADAVETTDAVNLQQVTDLLGDLSDSDITVSSPSETSPSGAAANLYEQGVEVKTSIDTLFAGLAGVSGASVQIQAESTATPIILTTTATVLPIETVTASNNTSIIDVDDADDEINIYYAARYTIATTIEVSNAGLERTLYIVTRNKDTEDILNTRSITIPAAGLPRTTLETLYITTTEAINVEILIYGDTTHASFTLDFFMSSVVTETAIEGYYVPYTGATADLDLGSHGLYADLVWVGDGGTSGGMSADDSVFTAKHGYFGINISDSQLVLLADSDTGHYITLSGVGSTAVDGIWIDDTVFRYGTGSALSDTYLSIDGSNANQNIDLGAYGIVNSSTPIKTGSSTTVDSSAGDYTLSSQHKHLIGSNSFYKREWVYRFSSGSDWTTSAYHSGFSVDETYDVPRTSTRCWQESRPSLGIQFWGDQATVGMILSSSGALTTAVSVNTPAYYVDGTAGASFSGTPTSITVVNGIITAIS